MSGSESDADLLPIGTVALRLGLPYWRLQRLSRAGAFPCVGAGHLRLVRVGDLEAVRAVVSEAIARGRRREVSSLAAAAV